MKLSLWMTAWQEGKAKFPMLHHLPADSPLLATVPAVSPLLATIPADSPLIATMQKLTGANNPESLLHAQAIPHADCLLALRLTTWSHIPSPYS